MDFDSPDFKNALERASVEAGLPDYYQGCVFPLFDMPSSQWPTCCAGNCDPCARKLVAVARRVYELLGTTS